MEKWKEIPGYDGMYQISNLGRVRSWKNGRWPGKAKTPKIMALNFFGQYHGVNLYKDGIESKKYVHRLVAKNFIPNPENKSQVNHKNFKKTDNRAKNLEWVTDQENKTHAVHEGKYSKKLNENIVLNIVQDYENGLSTCALEDKYDIARSTAVRIVNGTNWKDLTGINK